MASITLKNVSKVYPGGVKAVDDFSLKIEDRRFVVLVGPSGCGKSTTLRMIAGLEEITEGELHIGDRLVNNVAPKDRDIAMVFQNYALYPHMTVFENMSFGLRMRKTPKEETERLVKEAAEKLGIGALLERKPKALSGGERQRVALGRAMVRNPAAFLLDEPLSNLDAKLRQAMRTELTRLHRDLAATFVFVTHDQTEAMTMGDLIVVMKDGRIRQADKPQTLYDRPADMFVAGFIGNPQMNFMDGSALPADAARAGRGKAVKLGIRPENIHIGDAFFDAHKESALTARVEIAEPLGNEILLYINFAGNPLVARTPPGGVYAPGAEIKFAVDTDKLHFFDRETEAALAVQSRP